MSSMNLERRTAEIYQFPVGGRAGLRKQTVQSSDYLASVGACEAVIGSSWYHEEAMEAERRQKN